jgi:membrane protease subunit HflC
MGDSGLKLGGVRLSPALILGAALALVLLIYMVTFQVRFDQTAVLTTFDEAGPSAVKEEPGLYLKWPYPIQEVRFYDRRVQVLESPLEQLRLRDDQLVVIGTYVDWQIQDPLKFFRSLKSVSDAEGQLRNRLRDAQSVIGQYALDELTQSDPKANKLSEVETKIREKLSDDMKAQDYGIAVAAVGLKRLMPPEQVTPKYYEHMRKSCEQRAQGARSEGQAAADSIRAAAARDKDTILAFAERHADNLKAEAQRNSAGYLKEFQQNEDFAIYLKQLEALRKTLQHNTTFLLDTQTAPFDLLAEPKGEAGKNPFPAPRPRAP